MKKVSELTGAELDFWILSARKTQSGSTTENAKAAAEALILLFESSPSTNWAHGGQIIEREKIAIYYDHIDDKWNATKIGGVLMFFNGETPLIAAMRCYVASVYGEYVDD